MKICSLTEECTHFVWMDLNGGICDLKTGNVKKNDAKYIYFFNSFCGYNESRLN